MPSVARCLLLPIQFTLGHPCKSQALVVTFCAFRTSQKTNLFHNVEEIRKKPPKVQLEFSFRTVTPRTVMRYCVCDSACYEACKKQSNALNEHNMFHLQGMVLEPVHLPKWEHSRIKWRKKDWGGIFLKWHTQSNVYFGGLALFLEQVPVEEKY